jgi:hypothetical protein
MMLAAGFGSTSQMPPLRLEVSEAAGQVIMCVVGESPVAVSASYELEVQGGAGASRNRSVQRGTAILRPQQPVTVATVKVGSSASEWLAVRLHVSPSSGTAYDLVWSSDSQGAPPR